MSKLLACLALGTMILVGCQQKQPTKPQPKRPTVTVVVYTATWCRPCQEAKPKIQKLRAYVRVQEVDCSVNFPRDIRSVPHYKVYDAQGNLVGEAESITALIAILKVLGVILPLLL